MARTQPVAWVIEWTEDGQRYGMFVPTREIAEMKQRKLLAGLTNGIDPEVTIQQTNAPRSGQMGVRMDVL